MSKNGVLVPILEDENFFSLKINSVLFPRGFLQNLGIRPEFGLRG